MRKITEIIIHCAATKPDFMPGATTAERIAEVRRWHVEDNGWSDIGYHYLIDRDGTRRTGRDLDRTGAHVKDHNTGTIGICLFGGHGSAATDRFEEHFTPEQDQALRALLHELQMRFGVLVKVTGHNQYAAKACPGFDVPTWLAAEHVAAPEPAEDQTDYVRMRWRMAAIRDAAIAALEEG